MFVMWSRGRQKGAWYINTSRDRRRGHTGGGGVLTVQWRGDSMDSKSLDHS